MRLKCISLTMLFLSLTACGGGNESAEATVNYFVDKMVEVASSPDDIFPSSLVVAQPEFQQMMECMREHLDTQGWTESHHKGYLKYAPSFFGSDSKKLSKDQEQEAMQYIVPVSLAHADCQPL